MFVRHDRDNNRIGSQLGAQAGEGSVGGGGVVPGRIEDVALFTDERCGGDDSHGHATHGRRQRPAIE